MIKVILCGRAYMESSHVSYDTLARPRQRVLLAKRLLALAAALSAVSSWAQYEEYDAAHGYVTMTASDSAGHSMSWTGHHDHWSDGKDPHSTTNYFVPAGCALWAPQNGKDNHSKATSSVWAGGKLVIAGYLWTRNNKNQTANLPKVDDLVFLGGSYVYGNWDTGGLRDSHVTVDDLATAKQPFEVRATSPNASYSGNCYLINSDFSGGSDTVVWLHTMDDSFMPTTNCVGTGCFESYDGKVLVSGKKTIVSQYGAGGFGFGGALEVKDGAMLVGAASDADWTSYATTSVGSLTLKDGGRLQLWIRNGTIRPLIEVSDGISIESVTNLIVSNFPFGLRGTTADQTECRLVVAHLAPGATCSLPSGKVLLGTLVNGESSSICTDWEYEAVDDGNGGKNVCLVHRQHVTSTLKKDERNNPVNCAFGPYSAGGGGEASFWSDGKCPKGNDAVDCVLPFGWYPMRDIDLPNATVTHVNTGEIIANGDAAVFRLKEFNLVDSGSFGKWSYSDSGRRTMTFCGGKVNLIGSKEQAFAVSTRCVYNFLSDITGTKTLYAHDRNVSTENDRQGTVSFSGDNRAFHGRLVLENHCPIPDERTTDKCFCTYLGDAKGWGGAFTQDEDTYSAITLKGRLMVYVTNDVTFAAETGRDMFVTNGVRFNVFSGRTLKLANRLTDYGPIVKIGSGTLELAGVADVWRDDAGDAAHTNELRVLAGVLKISSRTACDGMDVVFANGTKLVLAEGYSDGLCNLKAANPITIQATSGKLPVEIMRSEKPEKDTEITVCTLTETAANGLTTENFEILRTPACRIKSFERRVSDGKVSFVATLWGKKGLAIIVR